MMHPAGGELSSPVRGGGSTNNRREGAFGRGGVGVGSHAGGATRGGVKREKSIFAVWIKCSFLTVAWFTLSTSLALYNKAVLVRSAGAQSQAPPVPSN